MQRSQYLRLFFGKKSFRIRASQYVVSRNFGVGGVRLTNLHISDQAVHRPYYSVVIHIKSSVREIDPEVNVAALNSGHCNAATLGPWDTGTLGHWDTGTLGHGVTGQWDTRDTQGLHTSRRWDSGTLRLWDSRTLGQSKLAHIDGSVAGTLAQRDS